MLAFALLALLAAAAIARAQPTDVQELAEPLAAWSADLERTEKTLSRDDLDDETLVHLREGLESVGTNAQAFVEKMRERLLAGQTQLAKLGPAPKPEDRPEAEAAARERQQLGELVSGLDGAIRTAQVLQTRAAQLADTVQDRRRIVFSKQLLTRVASPFTARFWNPMRQGIDVAVLSLRLFADDWRTGIQEPWLLVLALAIALAAWVALRQLALGLIARYRSTAGSEPPPFLRRAASAAGVTLARALPPIAAALVLYGELIAFDLLHGRSQTLAQAALHAVIAVALLVALITTVLAPRQPRWRIFPAGDRAAKRLRWLAVGIAWVYGIDLFVSALNHILVTPLPVTIGQKLATTVLMAALLAGLLATPIGDRADESEAASASGGWLRGLLWLVLIGLATASGLGYIALAHFLASQLVITGSVLSIFYLLHVTVEELAVGLANLETRTGRWVAARLALEQRRREQTAVLVSLLLNTLLIVGLVPLLLVQWGFDGEDVRRWLSKALFGFQLGSWNVSVAALLSAFLLFVVGIIATRLFQHWLDTGVLKRAGFEQGARSAIGTVVGYIGVIIAAIVAFSYTGLDFSNIALVAGALGVGIGFGLQSIVNNFVSGLILLAERRISVGDWIIVGEEEGHVRRISVRATEIETFDRNYVIIPNAELITHTVKNWTFRHRRARVVIVIGVGYNSDAEQVRDMLLACAAEHPDVIDHPAPRVLFDDFGDNALMFRLVAFIGEVDKLIQVRSELRFMILKAVRAAGVDIPFPQRDLHLKDIDRLEQALTGWQPPALDEAAEEAGDSPTAGPRPGRGHATPRRR